MSNEQPQPFVYTEDITEPPEDVANDGEVERPKEQEKTDGE